MSLALLASQLTHAQITSPAPYCAASYDDGFMPVPHYITNVSLGTLNNTTGTTQFAAPHYAYYNTVAAPNLVRGTSYPISIGHNGGTSIHFVAVYIDYNRNNSFSDPGELVLQQNIVTGAVTNPSTATITIPATATVGTTRMRVMVFEDDDYTWGSGATTPLPCTADATGTFDWGETEDYNVNITGGTTPSGPVAAFSGSPLTGTTATNFTFTDASTNTPTSWQWTFTPNTVVYQGGTSATSANPIVKFTANGTYTVKLKVTNASGADSLTRTNYITVAGTVPAPVAAFTGSPLTGSTATIFTLTDASTNTPTSWQWTFTPNTVAYQGGTSATSANPIVKFTANGIYTVKLKVTNASGADSLTRTNYITVAGTVPVPAFSVSPSTGGTMATIFTFTDLSTNTPNAWVWSFSPATVSYQASTSATSAAPKVRFTANGLYTVKLKVSNASGTDSLTKLNYVAVGPTGVADVTNTPVATVFPNPASNQWHIVLADENDIINAISVYDITGKMVLNVSNSSTVVDVSSLATGQYLLVIHTNNGTQTGRASIQK